MVLAVALTLLLAQAATKPTTTHPSLLSLALPRKAAMSASKVEVLRVNPWIDYITAIRPSSVEQAAAVKVVMTHADHFGIATITDELDQDEVLEPGCGAEHYTPETFPVSWAIRYFDENDNDIGSIYLAANGLCVLAGKAVYSIDPTLLVFLERTYGPLNF